MDLFDKLKQLREQGLEDIKKAADEKKLNEVRVELIGKKGELTQILHSMKDVAPENRREVGQKVNELRDLFNAQLDNAKEEIVKALIAKKLEEEKIDVTLPGREGHLGSKHPINVILDDLESYFIGMGYQVVQGPEIETDHYCFEMMNLPKDHPARDMQATFYIDSENLLRTQTSGDQARVLEKHDFSKGPLKMVGPGKVYRRDDDDATHSHQFMQMEGLVVDKNVTMSDLKGTLDSFMTASKNSPAARYPIQLSTMKRDINKLKNFTEMDWNERLVDEMSYDIKRLNIVLPNVN